jgi:nitrilase
MDSQQNGATMSNTKSSPFTIAAIQAAPVFLDRDATVEKACDLIGEVGKAGAKLAVFPEAYIPAFPLWVWFIPPGDTHGLRELYAELVANSVAIPSDATDRLCAAARDAGVNVAIGVNECNAESSGTTIYDTILYIGSDGRVLGKHRKMVPTTGERIVWGQGDGSTLIVVNPGSRRCATLRKRDAFISYRVAVQCGRQTSLTVTLSNRSIWKVSGNG